MLSISKYMDEYDIAQEVRLERKIHKGSFLLLEGETDIDRFAKFVDEKYCSFVNCWGRKNALLTTEHLYDEGFPGVLCIVDADFDRVIGALKQHEGVLYSASHDLDLDWARPAVVGRYLQQVGDRAKCAAHGSPDAIVNKILAGLKLVSVARFLNKRGHITYKLSDIDVSTFFSDFACDVNMYIAKVFEGRNVTTDEQLKFKAQLVRASERDYDLEQISNGHDFCSALGAALREDLGDRRAAHTWGSEIELHLRLEFSDNDFRSLPIFNLIRNWTSENQPYIILRPHLH